MAAREEVRERAVRVYRHLIHGLMPQDIVKVEALPEHQVYYLIQEGGRILGGQLATLTETGLLRELVLHCRERRKHLWLQYQTTRNDNLGTAKVAMMRQLLAEDQHLIDLAERLKLVEPKVTKVEHGGAVEVRHQFFANIIRRSKAVVNPLLPEPHGNGAARN